MTLIDIQLSFFPEDTTDEMGGTFFVPGTHYRNVQTAEIRAYHHMVGKICANCKAGTIFIFASFPREIIFFQQN